MYTPPMRLQSEVALKKNKHSQELCGKVSGVKMFTTGQAVVIMTKKGSNAYTLLAIRPRKMVAQLTLLSHKHSKSVATTGGSLMLRCVP